MIPPGCPRSFTDFARFQSTRVDWSSWETQLQAGLKTFSIWSKFKLFYKNKYSTNKAYRCSKSDTYAACTTFVTNLGDRDPRAAQQPRIHQGWTELWFQQKVSMIHVQLYGSVCLFLCCIVISSLYVRLLVTSFKTQLCLIKFLFFLQISII